MCLFTFSTDERKGVPIGPRAFSYWLYNVPWGLHKAVMYIKERYGNPTVILAENGMSLNLKHFSNYKNQHVNMSICVKLQWPTNI